MHKIAVIGTGYVGLVTGTCLADFGMDTVCVDMNEEKINNLKKGEDTDLRTGINGNGHSQCTIQTTTFYNQHGRSRE